MSLPDKAPRAPGFSARNLAVVLLVLVVGACGFEPLYGKRGGDGPGADVASIRVAPIKDRIGHTLRNHLIDGLTPDGEPANADYRLVVEVEQSTAPLLIQLDDTTTRFNLTLRADFSLFDRTGGAVYSGSAKAIGSYNVVDSEFATVIAEEDAEREAARTLGDEIRSLILVFFTRQPDG